MKLYLSDLKLIGEHTIKNSQGFCVFICNKSTATFDFLFLRTILEENGFGRLSLNNVTSLDENSIQIHTNFLYIQYKHLQENEIKEQKK